MSTAALDNHQRVREPQSLRRRLYSFFAIAIIWIISLIVLVLGLPLIIYQRITGQVGR